MKYSRFLFIVLGMISSIGLSLAQHSKDTNAKLKIAVTQIVEHPALDETRKGLYDRLVEEGYEGDKLSWTYDSAQGNMSLAAQIAQKFVGQKPDVIVAIATPSAQSFLSANAQSQIPVVFTSVSDPLGAKLVKDLKNPQGFMTGVSNMIDWSPQLDLIKNLVPTLKTVGVIYNPGEANSVTLIEQFKSLCKEQNIKVVPAMANKSIDVGPAAQSLVGKVDLIFITNDSTAFSAFDAVAKTGLEAKIPIVVSDIDLIDQGALAAIGPNQYEIGRQTGEMVINIINGQNPSTMPVVFPDRIDLALNLKTAKAINLSISEDLLKRATVTVGKQHKEK